MGRFLGKRKARYGTSTFGDDSPLPRTIEIKNTLLKQVRWPGLKDGDFKLSEVLEQLSRVYNLEFDINEKAFAADGVMDVNSQIVASADKPLPCEWFYFDGIEKDSRENSCRFNCNFPDKKGKY